MGSNEVRKPAGEAEKMSGLHEGENPQAGLGTTYQKCVDGRRKTEKWALLREAGKLLPEERVAGCCRSLISKGLSVTVWKSVETGKTFFGNVTRCGSVWQCPVCAGKITEARRKELQEGLKTWTAAKGKVFLLTLTIPHHAGSNVKELCSQLLRALKFLQNRTHWRAFRFAVGLRGTVRALEVTYGKNGAHVHIHMLLFCDGKRNPEKADILGSWQQACESAGLPEPNEHGVDIRDGTYAAQYVGKWGLDCELTKAHVKRGNGAGRTPWDLLRCSVQGDDEAGYLFKQHAAAFFRKRQLVWSRGLRALLGLLPEKSDEELAEEKESQVEEIASICVSDWMMVLRSDVRGDLLFEAEQGAGALEAFLIRLRVLCREDWRARHWVN